MSNTIKLLPEHVCNQIAAGEVIQRSSSIVKELLENSIDAGAKNIKLRIKDAGKTLIQVIDNGKGMSTEDALICFKRHATSKIISAEDLFRINTNGFRGEALASIAAVAHVELKTKTKDSQTGTLVRIEGSELKESNDISIPTGTILSVKNLFFNIPARRNFLKSNSIELRHIIEEFQRISLAYPDISFSMYHNDNCTYDLKPTNLRKRVVSIFGNKINERLIPVNEETNILQINGFVIKPAFSRKKRGEQFFFVNNRFIKSPYFNHAVISAYDGLLAKKTFPSYFLFLSVPTDSIDINIHPSKTEIKFDDETTLYAIIRSTIKHSLGQYSVTNVLDFDSDNSLDTPYEFKDKKIKQPKINVDSKFNPFKDREININYQEYSKEGSWQSLIIQDNQTNDKSETSHTAGTTTEQPSSYIDKGISDEKKDRSHLINSSLDSLTENKDDYNIYAKDRTKNKESNNYNLFDSAGLWDSLVKNKTYQIHKKYIVSTLKSGVIYIHQQYAHQRILYEEYLRNITVKDAPSQQLLFPLYISFNKLDIILIREIQADLESIGFDFDNITDQSIVVKGIPTTIVESQISAIIEQLIEDVKNNVSQSSFSQMDIMAKSLAKSMAIRTDSELTVKEQEEIVNKLFICKDPAISPFGKKTFVTVTLKEIDKKFN